MIVKLQRWVSEYVSDEEDEMLIYDIAPKGFYLEYTIRADKIDGYSVETDELILIIGGNEYFFDYDELIYNQIENYFNLMNTKLN